jgi:hypothetical protein
MFLQGKTITLAELIAQLALLPPETIVARISRDNREACIAMGISASTIEHEPEVEITLRLPKYTFNRTGGLE